MNVITYKHTYRIRWGWQKLGAPQGQVDYPLVSFVDQLPSMEPWDWQLLFDVELLCNEQELWEMLTIQDCTKATDSLA